MRLYVHLFTTVTGREQGSLIAEESKCGTLIDYLD